MEVGAFSYQFKEGGAYCFHHKRLSCRKWVRRLHRLLNVIRQVIEEIQSSELLQLANRERQPVDVLVPYRSFVCSVRKAMPSYVLPFFIRSAIQ